MKTIVLANLLAFFAAAQLCAQQGSIEPVLITPCGGFAQTTDGSVSWSTGEIAIEHVQTATALLTQGFQQPDSATTAPPPPPARYISDVITPDDDLDGLNAIFDPVYEIEQLYPNNKVITAELTILTRWGERVFYEESPAPKWDGKTKSGMPFPQATYYYVLKVKLDSGDLPPIMRTVTILN